MEAKLEKIQLIIEDVADIPVDEINVDSSFMDDLDLSSLEIMSIVSKIEKEFSVKLSEKELLSVETVADMVELIA
ncbi:acyl carrier protein [Pseudobutyrivibrio sp. YE44]|uniref:acyl carrier protein n=1 Tax=Pseudobutyrivibrio sp. YE44 TaxID=1520802 RepID=UPI0008809069|nr:phosphopantetheine-binding protein [Pseudobutyrivibrio sp. YE44]SDB46256.1 acyl carrier protein [Pseudobutyrivibrio sp. YE44]